MTDSASLVKQLAFNELMRADRVSIDEVKQASDSWEPLVGQLADFALNRFGRRNNNWLRIIPMVMHELAGEVSERVASTHDVTIRVQGQDSWQDTFWSEWEDTLPQENVEPVPDYNEDLDPAQAEAHRYKQMMERTETMDPFYEDSMMQWQETQSPETDQSEPEPEHDEDLLM